MRSKIFVLLFCLLFLVSDSLTVELLHEQSQQELLLEEQLVLEGLDFSLPASSVNAYFDANATNIHGFDHLSDPESRDVSSLSDQTVSSSSNSVSSFSTTNSTSSSSSSSKKNSSANLKKLIHFHRHGARTSEREGMQLTKKGEEQLVELGRMIYDRYESHLSDVDHFFQDLQVYSTNYNRTISSAERFLFGVFSSLFNKSEHFENEESFESKIANFTSSQMIQIYKTNYNTDLLLNGWRQSECIKQKELIKIQINSQFFRELFAFLLPIAQDISTLTESPLNNFYDAYLLYDELVSSQVEGRLSEPLETLLANETMYTTLRFMNDFSAIYTFYGSPLQIKITTQTLMMKILEVFSSPTSPSFTVFSAHDITMDGMFVALNLTNPECLLKKYFHDMNIQAYFEFPFEYGQHEECLSSPSFAANIQIELYDDNSIAFIYNNTTYNIPQLQSLGALSEFIESFYQNINSNLSCSSEHHKYLRYEF